MCGGKRNNQDRSLCHSSPPQHPELQAIMLDVVPQRDAATVQPLPLRMAAEDVDRQGQPEGHSSSLFGPTCDGASVRVGSVSPYIIWGAAVADPAAAMPLRRYPLCTAHTKASELTSADVLVFRFSCSLLCFQLKVYS